MRGIEMLGSVDFDLASAVKPSTPDALWSL